MAEARCPASCGELVQGWIAGNEKLISCPIDWFSTVSVTSGDPHLGTARPLMTQALALALQSMDIPAQELRGLQLQYESTIPVAKGMASSTADIAAAITAAYRYYHHALSEFQLATLCAQLEPTDSTIFRTLTLFDHNQGIPVRQYGQFEMLDILVLESPQQMNTAAYHQMDRHQQLQRSSFKINHAVRLIEHSINTQDARQMGLATTISAIESQKIITKPYFTPLLKLIEKYDLYGLNVAHSGTVVGLLYHSSTHDIDAVIHAIQHSPLGQTYRKLHAKRMVSGGIR